MYKFLVIAFLFLIAVGIYEQNNISLMNDKDPKHNIPDNHMNSIQPKFGDMK